MQRFYDCGIDLGTTNSCVAVPDEKDGFKIIENQADGMIVTPSAVSISGLGRILTGQRAYNHQNPDELAIQFKRNMGTNTEYHFKTSGIVMTPEELSSEILKRLKSDAESRCLRSMRNAVITVPAAFKTLQSEATNKAGELAGFNNVVLLQEPIAAAVAYGAHAESTDKYWMVFDYGGGTLDVAIVSTVNGRLEVINSEGNNYFGGCDIDRLILDQIILPRLKNEYNISGMIDENKPEGRSLIRKLLLLCESCKISLSNRNSDWFQLFDVTDDDGYEIEFEYEINRDEFNEIILNTVDRSIAIAKRALTGANLKPEQLDKIILVGGSTFIPLVREKLFDAFGVPFDNVINPMTVVAAGAAVYASTLFADVEEDASFDDLDSAVISLTYDTQTSEENAEVVGKISNIKRIKASKIRIDCARSGDYSGVFWTSGWIDFLDAENGVFDINVYLKKNAVNNFKIYICDKTGKSIPVVNSIFQIKHSDNVLRNSAPPVTASIGVKVVDPEYPKFNKNEILIKKNTPLPAKGFNIFKTTKDIDPDGNDQITIEILEGENEINPFACATAGIIVIESSQMNAFIPKDTEIEIEIEIDKNRNISVAGYIPDFDYEIPKETLRQETKMDVEKALDSLYERIENAKNSLNRIEEYSKEWSELSVRYKKISEAYKKIYDNKFSNESEVHRYIDDFDELETAIVRFEREKAKPVTSFDDDTESLAQIKDSIDTYGDEEANEQYETLVEDLNAAETKTEKAFVIEELTKLEQNTRLNNMGYVKNLFKFYEEKDNYTYPSKAEYWKARGREAIEENNVDALWDYINKLYYLTPDSSKSEFSKENLADLTLK